MLSNSSVETKSCFDSRHSCFLNSVFCLGYFRQRLVCRFRCSTFCYSNFEFLFQSRLQKISVVLPALEASLPPPDVLWAVLGFLLASLLGFSPPELPGRRRVPWSRLYPTQGLRRLRQAQDKVVQTTVQAWPR